MILEQAVIDANPGLTVEELTARANATAAALEVEISGGMEAVSDRADFEALMGTVERDCDDVAASHPRVLRRTRATGARWEDLLAMGRRNYPQQVTRGFALAASADNGL